MLHLHCQQLLRVAIADLDPTWLGRGRLRKHRQTHHHGHCHPANPADHVSSMPIRRHQLRSAKEKSFIAATGSPPIAPSKAPHSRAPTVASGRYTVVSFPRYTKSPGRRPSGRFLRPSSITRIPDTTRITPKIASSFPSSIALIPTDD